MRDDFLTFGRPLIGEEEIAAVVATLRSGWLGTGPRVARFERELEAYLEIPHVRCVSSCTDQRPSEGQEVVPHPVKAVGTE
jgi:dTDP-4-amino-4,6-dideoxygalactose transaminase